MLRALPVLLLALAAACSGASGDRAPTVTLPAGSTPESESATAAGAVPATPTTAATATARTCSDPYPDGAPFDTQPGQPIRLRPTGSPPALPPAQAAQPASDPELERIVRFVLGGNANRVSVVIKRLDDGRGVAIDPNRVHYAASLFKTWVMLEAHHQRSAGLLDFGERYVVTGHYRSYGLGPGQLAECDAATIDQAMRSMMRISDNVAANLVLDRIGAGNVNQALLDLGLRRTAISPQSLTTTAADMALLLEAIARRRAVDQAASDSMLELLDSESIDDRLPALLPPGTRVAHKTGNWENATHDAGIVFHPHGAYVIVVLTDFGFDDDGARLIAQLSRVVYDYFNR